MKLKKIIITITALISLILFLLLFGIEFDREWGDPNPFVKYKISSKIVFHCPGGEQDDKDAGRTEKDIIECGRYQEFTIDNTATPLLMILELLLFAITTTLIFVLLKEVFFRSVTNRYTLRHIGILAILNVPFSTIALVGSHLIASQLYYHLIKGYQMETYLYSFVIIVILLEWLLLLGISRMVNRHKRIGEN